MGKIPVSGDLAGDPGVPDRSTRALARATKLQDRKKPAPSTSKRSQGFNSLVASSASLPSSYGNGNGNGSRDSVGGAYSLGATYARPLQERHHRNGNGVSDDERTELGKVPRLTDTRPLSEKLGVPSPNSRSRT